MSKFIQQRQYGVPTKLLGLNPASVATKAIGSGLEGVTNTIKSGTEIINNDLTGSNSNVFGIQNNAAMGNNKGSIMGKSFSNSTWQNLRDDVRDSVSSVGNKFTGTVGSIGGGITGGLGGGVAGSIFGLKGALVGSALGSVIGSRIGEEKGSAAFSHYSDTINNQDQRNYSIMTNVGGIAKNLGGFAKDMRYLAKRNYKSFLKPAINIGVTGAVAGYAVDKAITHDAKKIGLMPQNPNSSQPQQPQPQVVPQQRQYVAIAPICSAVGKGAKAVGNYLKWNKKSIATTAALSAALPAVGYAFQRKAYMDSIKNTSPQNGYVSTEVTQPQFIMATNQQQVNQQQPVQTRQFTVINSGLIKQGATLAGGLLKQGASQAGNLAKKGAIGLRDWVTQPKKAGYLAEKMKIVGNASGNQYTKNVANFISNHPNVAGAGLVVGGMKLSQAAINTGSKVAKSTIGAFDKNAYQYQNQQNQMVQ